MSTIKALLLTLLLQVPLSYWLFADAIPEPPITMYGVVLDDAGGRLTRGTLTVVIRPPGGAPAIPLSTVLQDLNGQFSYALRLPCESLLPGLTVSPGTLALSTLSVVFDRSEVALDGVPLPFRFETQKTFTAAARDRGTFHEVNFSLGGNTDSDGDELDDAWERRFFGNLDQTGDGDTDADGMPNRAEQFAGTDPTRADSKVAFIFTEALPGNRFQVQWSGAPGRRYQILRASDLLGDYQAVGGPMTMDATGVGSLTEAPPPTSSTYFYKLRIEGQ